VKAVEVLKFLWKRKQTCKHSTFWGAGRGNIFHKTWSKDVEAVKFLWQQKRKHFEEEAGSETTNFIWSWKRK